MDFTFVSRYAQYDPKLQRRKTWQEACNAVKDLHQKNYQDIPKIFSHINQAIQAQIEKEVLGSQRILQFAGEAVLKHNARAYNCAGLYFDKPESFAWGWYLLLCGTGVGGSVQTHHVQMLPRLYDVIPNTAKIYVVEDSIEGWADCMCVLWAAYTGYFPENREAEFRPYVNSRISFDFSKIRPKGAPFSHGIGVAPGPDGLRQSLERIVNIFERSITSGVTHLRSIDVYDIFMHQADAVLSGGIRRSATIILFSSDDELMMNAKTGSWFIENPQRGRSNNSAVLIRGLTSQEEFNRLFDSTKQFGEPGFFWVDDRDIITNPCCEIQFFCYDTTNPNWSRTPEFSGVQMCNLSTINGSKIKTESDFYTSVENATILGTLQAGYDDFPYLGTTSENIIRREALLGVSITGMMESEKILFNPEILQKGAILAKQINSKISKIIGINPAARICCIKPEGTTSTILGTCAGIHPSHARSYIRGVQCNKLDPITNHYIQHNPSCVEESCWSASKVDYFVKFYCEVPKTTILKKQLTALAMLDKIKLVQQYWVTEGRNPELCTANSEMTHNVSNTVTVLDDEWNYVRDYIFENQKFFSGISLLSVSGDKDFRQAPFVEVKSGEEILTTYGNAAMFTSGLIEDAQSAFGDLWSACSSILGFSEIVEVSHLKDKIAAEEGSEKWVNSGLHKTSTTSCLEKYLETTTTNWYFKNQWCQRLRKFAKNHKIDIKTCCDMLKDVYILNDAMKITRNHKKVDFSQCVEHSNNTAGTQEIACAGGACVV